MFGVGLEFKGKPQNYFKQGRQHCTHFLGDKQPQQRMALNHPGHWHKQRQQRCKHIRVLRLNVVSCTPLGRMTCLSRAQGGAVFHDLTHGGWNAASSQLLLVLLPSHNPLKVVPTAPGLEN